MIAVVGCWTATHVSDFPHVFKFCKVFCFMPLIVRHSSKGNVANVPNQVVTCELPEGLYVNSTCSLVTTGYDLFNISEWVCVRQCSWIAWWQLWSVHNAAKHQLSTCECQTTVLSLCCLLLCCLWLCCLLLWRTHQDWNVMWPPFISIHDVHFDQPRKGKIGMCFPGFVVPYKALMGSIPPSRIHYSSRKMGHRLTHTCSRRARKITVPRIVELFWATIRLGK